MYSTHLAIDLGASSGRALLGVLAGDPKTLQVEEIHRFHHTAIDTPTGPVWDFTGIANHVVTSLKIAAEKARLAGHELKSIGVDGWGVDWGVVGPSGEMIGLPHCYRDPANTLARENALASFDGGAETLFARNGIQPLPFNTLFQVYGRLQTAPEVVPSEGRLLLLPDLLHYWLSGCLANERTNASTGGLLLRGGSDWDLESIAQLGIPATLLGELRDPGTRLGPLRSEIRDKVGLTNPVEVVAPATHDTASAVAAVPAADRAPRTWAYLSSGTWSLLGAELSEPITTPAALEAGFTNEVGVSRDGVPTIRFLRNIGGLWLLQELQRDLATQGTNLSFAELAQLATDAAPLRTIVDPNSADLAAPNDIVDKLRRHAERTGQPLPQTPGELARCCLESLALCYAETIEHLEKLVGYEVKTLFAVGGGTKNGLLNRLTAAAIKRPLVVGPVEASGIGNLLVQAIGLGLVEGPDELREIVARSFPIHRVEPEAADVEGDWEAAHRLYAKITSDSNTKAVEDE